MSAIVKTDSVRKVYEKSDLVRQLRDLGLETGDTVLVRADLGKLGRVQRPTDFTFVESLLEAVGSTGTILALTHSPCHWAFRPHRTYVFEPATAPCLNGRFAQTICHWADAYRSRHPTCSMAGVGRLARELLAEHDHTATCFGPIKPFLDANGKFLVVGCTRNSPGFSTVHYAYEHLGLATKSLLNGWLGCFYKNENRVAWFSQRDIPGCSLGFHQFYPLYQQRSMLRVGPVGNAESFLIRSTDSFAIERAVIAANPKFSLCDNPECFSCRATKLFNPLDIPKYFLTQGPKKLLRYFRRGRGK